VRAIVGLTALCCCLVPLAAEGAPAEGGRSGPRLGALFGASFPHGDGSWDPSFSWGFFVDLPLVESFQLSPSALVYELDPEGDEAAGVSATDVSLSFKFVVPISALELFAGFTTGLTSARDLDVHFGGQAGLGWRITRNFEAVTSVHYKVILEGRGNIQDLKAFIGPAFRF
jgi:hypothetical protein